MDPNFGAQSFVFLLKSETPTDEKGWDKLVAEDDDSLHFCCTSVPKDSKSSHSTYNAMQREVVGVGRLDWRKSLTEGGREILVELRGGGGMEGAGRYRWSSTLSMMM